MKKLFSSIFSIFIFLVVALLTVTFYVSGESETRFRAFVKFMNKNEAVHIKIVSFNKGLFTSEAITRTVPNFVNTESAILMKHTIWNGPVIYTGTKVKPFELQLAKVISVPQELPKSVELAFTITSILSFEGAIDSYLQGTSFSLTRPELKVQGQQWETRVQFSKYLSNIHVDGHLPSVTVDFMGMAFQINNITTKVDATRSKLGTWVGNSRFNVEQVIAELPGIELKGFESQEISSMKDDLMFVDWKIKFEKFNFAKIGYGPLNINIQLNKINPIVITELTRSKGQLKAPERTLKKFLSVKPEIIVKESSFMLPQGLVSLDAGLAFGGSEMTLPINSNTLEKTLDGHILASIPKELLREGLGMGLMNEIAKDPEFQKLDDAHKKQHFELQIDLKIKKLQTEGILVEQDKNYAVKISIDKGQWKANGKEITQPLS